MVITRLVLAGLPFVRHKMKDIADVELLRDYSRCEKWVISKIEGKDSSSLMSDSGQVHTRYTETRPRAVQHGRT